MKNKYAVYVSDPNGWDDGCQDSEGVFFGSPKDHGGVYHRHDSFDVVTAGDLGGQGFVEVDGHKSAIALRDRLNSTGDWVAPFEINEDGAITRPKYGLRKIYTISEVRL